MTQYTPYLIDGVAVQHFGPIICSLLVNPVGETLYMYFTEATVAAISENARVFCTMSLWESETAGTLTLAGYPGTFDIMASIYDGHLTNVGNVVVNSQLRTMLWDLTLAQHTAEFDVFKETVLKFSTLTSVIEFLIVDSETHTQVLHTGNTITVGYQLN
jgi:hypothetical protein